MHDLLVRQTTLSSAYYTREHVKQACILSAAWNQQWSGRHMDIKTVSKPIQTKLPTPPLSNYHYHDVPPCVDGDANQRLLLAAARRRLLVTTGSAEHGHCPVLVRAHELGNKCLDVENCLCTLLQTLLVVGRQAYSLHLCRSTTYYSTRSVLAAGDC